MFRTRQFYSTVCDACGKTHEGYEHDWWIEETMAEEDAVDDDWQAYTGPDGTRRHRCPDHWGLTCTRCGAQAGPAPVDGLRTVGWEYGDDTLCPACANTPDDPPLTCTLLLVEAHCGGLYTVEARPDTDRQRDEIMQTCDQCGDTDWVTGDAATWGQLCRLLIGRAADGVEADYLMKVARQDGARYCPHAAPHMFDMLETRLREAERRYWVEDETGGDVMSDDASLRRSCDQGFVRAALEEHAARTNPGL
ncbi:hypothetical protein [Bifidobacterium castoris]|uniref:Uncharacterized protein n=1 Tax=Bifidobacterium castoris TaxID=2306972 RepID=A0A430FAD7_9BIFI|nr:hypothetical protein [Bifidobacterium castoris]RSX49801.1 hypothetical protein D2E22_0262 [Bifidobacterium castoris]